MRTYHENIFIGIFDALLINYPHLGTLCKRYIQHSLQVEQQYLLTTYLRRFHPIYLVWNDFMHSGQTGTVHTTQIYHVLHLKALLLYRLVNFASVFFS